MTTNQPLSRRLTWKQLNKIVHNNLETIAFYELTNLIYKI